VAAGTLAPLAAKRATSTIPIVMLAAGDPLGSGLIASLARPGGNVTGMSLMAPDLGGKRLELLKEMVPKVRHVGILWNAANPYSALVLNARCSHSTPAENRYRETIQTPQGLHATQSNELFPIDESRLTSTLPGLGLAGFSRDTQRRAVSHSTRVGDCGPTQVLATQEKRGPTEIFGFSHCPAPLRGQKTGQLARYLTRTTHRGYDRRSTQPPRNCHRRKIMIKIKSVSS
jgi:hypothetical protein